MGAQGLNYPANVVVAVAVESNFSFDSPTPAALKRWYYYGPDVPDAAAVAAPYSAEISPRKRRAGASRRPSDPFADGIELSPGPDAMEG